MAALRDLTVTAGEPVELDAAERGAVTSVAWLCDPTHPWEVAQVVTRSGGRWWATDGISAVLVPATDGEPMTVTVDGDVVLRSDVIPRDPVAFGGFTCGLRRWSAATVDRDELAAVASDSDPTAAVTAVLERCRRRAPGTSRGEVPRVDTSRLAELAEHAPEGQVTVHHRGRLEPVIVIGADGWRGVLAPLAS